MQAGVLQEQIQQRRRLVGPREEGSENAAQQVGWQLPPVGAADVGCLQKFANGCRVKSMMVRTVEAEASAGGGMRRRLQESGGGSGSGVGLQSWLGAQTS